MKIEDLVNVIEICENFEVNPSDFREHFELDGKMMMMTFFDNRDYHFHCGPSIGNGCISDSVYTPNYLGNICNELKIKCDVEIAENYHSLDCDTITEAEFKYNLIKNRISKDFDVVDGNLL